MIHAFAHTLQWSLTDPCMTGVCSRVTVGSGYPHRAAAVRHGVWSRSVLSAARESRPAPPRAPAPRRPSTGTRGDLQSGLARGSCGNGIYPRSGMRTVLVLALVLVLAVALALVLVLVLVLELALVLERFRGAASRSLQLHAIAAGER